MDLSLAGCHWQIHLLCLTGDDPVLLYRSGNNLPRPARGETAYRQKPLLLKGGHFRQVKNWLFL
jgi:hypothetical protein